MKVFVTGGSGFIGRALTHLLLENGHQVTAIGSRHHPELSNTENFTYIAADTTNPGNWQQPVAEQDVLINLAGRSVFHLWSDAYKKTLYNSRILTTRNLVEALPDDSSGKVVISTSAAGFYGDGGDMELEEVSEPGKDFLAQVCNDWEAEANNARHKKSRVATARFGVVLGETGGALQTMKTPFKLGLGGPIGSGRQWFPWIHIQDLCQAIVFIIENNDASGPFNFTAPQTVRQKDFAATLGRALRRPVFMPAPAFFMKLILGEFGKSLLQGQKVKPTNLLTMGYKFSFPELDQALDDLL